MKRITNQNLFDVLMLYIMTIENTDSNSKTSIDGTFDLLFLNRDYIRRIPTSSPAKIEVEKFTKSLNSITLKDQSYKNLTKLKNKIIELKNLVQSEIEKEVQSDLFKEVA